MSSLAVGAAGVSIVIPTYRREQVLLDTVEALLGLRPPATEILLVDQTEEHDRPTELALTRWADDGAIRWLRLREPSITHAMNVGLIEAKYDLVLFLDDDIIPSIGLIAGHTSGYVNDEVVAVVGMVLQPGEEPRDVEPPRPRQGLSADLAFPFCSRRSDVVRSAMAGNMSVRRRRALALGGFDENFVGVAYRFETEFARRVWNHGGCVRFEPSAVIRHLKAERGGTRAAGGHLTSMSPLHGAGDYYFALCHGVSGESLNYMLKRPFREVRTRFHLRHPWWIPVKLLAEVRAFLLAVRLHRRGPRYAVTPLDVNGTQERLSATPTSAN